MPSQDDVREIEEGKAPKRKRRFDRRDFDFIADSTIELYEQRKKKRKDREAHWKEIDRQVSMIPDLSRKKDPSTGKIDNDKAWMPEVELPLQAQALEVLTADSRRMLSAGNRPWFRAHAEMTDDYLERVEFSSLILGDKAEVPSLIDQDNADQLAGGFLSHLFRQYDLAGRYDRINAEAFKYGMGVARGMIQTKQVFIDEAKGVRKESQRIPVLQPISVKNVYLDDPMPSTHTSSVLGPSHIFRDWIKLENLKMAANRGSRDPNNQDGGWMPENVNKLEADRDGFVKLLEIEGDLVIPRKTVSSMVVPGAIATVAVGGKAGNNEKVTNAVVRFRFRNRPQSSYILHPYHFEGADDHYPSSPLMKGRPIQIAAVNALENIMMSAAIKNAPPLGYDRSDPWFQQHGGPVVKPHAVWGTDVEISTYEKIGGDQAALSATLAMFVQLYAELTGVLPARLGAQTKSHTTAFSKDAELQRGAVRTVAYVDKTGQGPVTQWLDMAYQMGRASIRPNQSASFFIDAYGGFVNTSREQLPERAHFEWFGSGGPAEEQAKQQAKLAALQLAIQMDQLGVALGDQPVIRISDAIKQTLRDGGWTDVDTITRTEGLAGGDQAASGIQGIVESSRGPATAAVQALAG